MDKLLSAILAADSPENVKQEVYQKIRAASAGPQPPEVVAQILLISSNMALDCGESRSRNGGDIFTTWAFHNPEALRQFITGSFVVRLLDGRAQQSATAVKLLHACVRNLKDNRLDVEEYTGLVRSSVINFIRENHDVQTLDNLMKFLVAHTDCVPSVEYWPTMCLALIKTISQLALPKDESLLVDYIKSVGLFATFTSKLWQKQTSTLNRALALILEIVASKEGASGEPSVALAAVVQLVPVEIIPEAVGSVMCDQTLDDANLSAALHRLINWLGWITATNLPTWILAFLRALAGAKKYCILILATLNKVQVVFDCLRFQQLRTHTLPVLKLMLLSFQHSPQAFHKMVESIPSTVRLLRDENTPESRRVLLELNELSRTLMYHFSGFPDLYEPILEALAELEEPSIERMKSLLSENKWSSQSVQTEAAMVRLAKSGTGKVGLENLGNTCYVNSIIQALYMCDELRCMVFASPAYSLHSLPGKLQQLFAFLKLSERAAYSPRDFVTASRPTWFMAGQQNDCSEYLKYLLDQLHEAEKLGRRDEAEAGTRTGAGTGTGAGAGTGTLETQATAAMDTAESITDDHAEATSSATDCPDPDQKLTTIERLFMGQCRMTVSCLECGFISSRNENFFDLPLAFPDSDIRSRSEDPPTLVGGDSSSTCTNISEVQELAQGDSVPLEKLIHYYLQPEILKDDNQYHCTQCDKLKDAERTVCITRAPQYLLITLLRFSYDAKTQSRTKLLTDVTYPLTFLLTTKDQRIKAVKRKRGDSDGIEETEESSSTPANIGYQLNSVVVHSGMSSDCGHYYAYARHLNQSSLTRWYQFNDDRVSYAAYDSFSSLNSRFRLDTPYILVYRRMGDDLGPDPDLDRILVSAVERDNNLHRQQAEQSKKKVRFNLDPKGPGDPDEPSGGGCGLGGFPGLSSSRVVF